MNRVNLIPKAIVVQQLRRIHITRWLVGITLSGMAVAGVLGWDWLAAAKAKGLQAEVRALQQGIAVARADGLRYAREAALAQEQIQRADALRAKRSWSGVITLVASCLPEGAWLESFRTDPSTPSGRSRSRMKPDSKGAGEKSKSKTIAIESPQKLRVVGYAPNAVHPHQFVAKLKESQRFSDVTLTRSQQEPVLDGRFFRFEVVCEW